MVTGLLGCGSNPKSLDPWSFALPALHQPKIPTNVDMVGPINISKLKVINPVCLTKGDAGFELIDQ